MANILGEQYQKASSDNHYSKDFLKHKQKSENLPLQYDSNDKGNPINHEFTPTEMQIAMNRPRASSAGPDNIPDLLIKNLTPKAQGVVLKIFNNIWQQQKFPDIWRKAIIIPVFKPGKQKTEANSYRPISLTCTLCKLLERMVNARLMWYMEDKSLLHNAQNGFRPNRSTLDSILLLHTEACHALANRQEMLTAFIDIEKAFDTVWRYNVLKKLTDWKVTGNMLQFLRNFMENRTFQVRINGKLSNTFHQTNGIPQGSVLSSTLFLVAINSLPGIIPWFGYISSLNIRRRPDNILPRITNNHHPKDNPELTTNNREIVRRNWISLLCNKNNHNAVLQKTQQRSTRAAATLWSTTNTGTTSNIPRHNLRLETDLLDTHHHLKERLPSTPKSAESHSSHQLGERRKDHPTHLSSHDKI
jgi:hypothetical protein